MKKGISISDPYYFNIYLNEKLAKEEEKTQFPVMIVFNYESQTVFALICPSDHLTLAN